MYCLRFVLHKRVLILDFRLEKVSSEITLVTKQVGYDSELGCCSNSPCCSSSTVHLRNSAVFLSTPCRSSSEHRESLAFLLLIEILGFSEGLCSLCFAVRVFSWKALTQAVGPCQRVLYVLWVCHHLILQYWSVIEDQPGCRPCASAWWIPMSLSSLTDDRTEAFELGSCMCFWMNKTLWNSVFSQRKIASQFGLEVF